MRFFDDWKFRRRLKSSGQALILIVLTFMGLLLFLGLMIDLGQIFLAKGYLRRAADAASLAAAAQFRENRTIAEMRNAAEEVSKMNGIEPTLIEVETCASTGGTDPELCPQLVPGNMPKKLVRVTITLDYPMTFLSLLDIYSVRLKEVSISEAAAMDVVLVVDVSESMAWEGPAPASPSDPDHRDSSVCNPPVDDCEPMRQVKDAALAFAARILNKSTDEEDRLAIVTFATGWQAGERGTQVVLGGNGWTNQYSVAETAINDLKVYDPGPGQVYINDGNPPTMDPVPVNPVRMYAADGSYQGLECLRADFAAAPSTTPMAEAYSACGTTDIGGGLLLAGDQFAKDKRPEALWVVILLTDGIANATLATREDLNQGAPLDDVLLPGSSDPAYDVLVPNYPIGFCPPGTYVGEDTDPHRSYCQDDNASVTHSSTSFDYNADDFARDMARFVGCPAKVATPANGCGTMKGQGAVMFSIGLGAQIIREDSFGIPYGGSFLRFVAELGDDGNPDTPGQCDGVTDYEQNCGNYFYAQGGADLDKIFEAIYSRIFTRLTA